MNNFLGIGVIRLDMLFTKEIALTEVPRTNRRGSRMLLIRVWYYSKRDRIAAQDKIVTLEMVRSGLN